MKQHPVVTRAQWVEERKELLAREKALTRLNDEISELRRQLPWVHVESEYLFDTVAGGRTLSQLFHGYRQLLVYHFMFGPEWEQGCPSCSLWADNFNGLAVHLAQRDIRLVLVSRAPLAHLVAYRERMGWQLEWVSSLGSTFNEDFDVSFGAAALAQGKVYYNYDLRSMGQEEAPGISVFYRDDAGEIYHTYSSYGRGLDSLNAAYQLIDRTPLGRHEEGLPWPMAWVRRHDSYDPE